MGWSIKLFSVAGTAVRIHLTFFLLLAFIAALGWTRGGARGGHRRRSLHRPAVRLRRAARVRPRVRRAHSTASAPPTSRCSRSAASPRWSACRRSPARRSSLPWRGRPSISSSRWCWCFALGASFDLTQMAQLEQATSTAGRPGRCRQRRALRLQPDPGVPDGWRAGAAGAAGPAAGLHARHPDGGNHRPGAGVRLRPGWPARQSRC